MQLAADAETARASMLACKGALRGERSMEELLRENAYLSQLLKQKESQMAVAEQQWKKQLVEAVREATEDEEAPVSAPERGIEGKNGGYSFPLPSNHPFVDSKRAQATPQRGSAPIEVNRGIASMGVGRGVSPADAARISPTRDAARISPTRDAARITSPMNGSRVATPVGASRIASPLSSSEGFRTPSEETLLTQSLNTTKTTDSSLLSFDSLLNDVMRQANQLREVADYYERQE
mgnify:FL=1